MARCLGDVVFLHFLSITHSTVLPERRESISHGHEGEGCAGLETGGWSVSRELVREEFKRDVAVSGDAGEDAGE